MGKKRERLGRTGYRLTVYTTAHQRLRAEIEVGLSDEDAVRTVFHQIVMRFELDRNELTLLATALRTTVGLEADAE